MHQRSPAATTARAHDSEPPERRRDAAVELGVWHRERRGGRRGRTVLEEQLHSSEVASACGVVQRGIAAMPCEDILP